ncbi:hypothetical protein ACJ41O_000012 [Fusarium nematophilum]
MIPRGMSAMADAYLTPVMKSYVENFRKSFLGGLQDTRQTKCQFMQSDDGLVDFRRLSGLRAILSPLAGGLGVIGFDMGGTSTDVSRYAGTYEHVFETTTAGITIQSPQLDINTVAAGGGSILFWKNGLFSVGPDSAVGFLNIANKAICRSIRTLTEGKGYDVTRHRLAAFGGAGGQHACSLARILGIDEVVIHKYSSILLVNGMALANVIRESLEPSSSVLSAEILPTLQERMDCLRRPILVDDIRVRGIASDNITDENEGLSEQLAKADKNAGQVTTTVYKLENLPHFRHVLGPAVILDQTQTILILPGASAAVFPSRIVIRVGSPTEKIKTLTYVIDPIQLSIFSHRFMSIAEQMGRTLQKTRVSLNIKERLGFSCAVFGPDGGLVANAPMCRDALDDSTEIHLKITIEPGSGSAVFDFTGTMYQNYGNYNAPPSLGFFHQQPNDRRHLEGLHGMCGQQGTMNGIRMYGMEKAKPGEPFAGYMFMYGETICGGSGAGPTWHGVSSVHTHMTNTRVSDLEILEKRLPVLVRKFGLRPGSGGLSRYRGGDGAIRVIEARTKMTFTLSTDRRTRRLFGMAGGQPGKAGLNLALLDHPSGRKGFANVGGKGHFAPPARRAATYQHSRRRRLGQPRWRRKTGKWQS